MLQQIRTQEQFEVRSLSCYKPFFLRNIDHISGIVNTFLVYSYTPLNKYLISNNPLQDTTLNKSTGTLLHENDLLIIVK